MANRNLPRSRRTAPTARSGDWSDVRLHIVSGKGGTGKTTIAGALAIALATGGRRILLIEVEGRQGIAQMFDVPPLPYAERQVAVAPDGGDVYALAVDPEAALLEYLEMFYNMKRSAATLKKLGAVDFATTIAPGLRDVLLTGKAIEAVKRGERGSGPIYDAVVMDAPPTGRISRFLNVSKEVGNLAKIGPIKNQAESVMSIIQSPRTAVHLVTLLEEMPVQETLDGIAELRANQLPVGAIVVNMLRVPRFDPAGLDAACAGRISRADVKSGIQAAGLPKKLNLDKAADALIEEATEHAERVKLEQSQRARLDAADQHIYELPEINGGIDLSALYALARMLRAQGVA